MNAYRISSAAIVALASLAAAGCSPPVDRSEFNNSGLSVAVAQDASLAPRAPANPPPRIEAPPAAQASGLAAPARG